MGQYHPDQKVDRAIVNLLDELCSWERMTGQETLLILVPVENDVPVVMAESGKPVPLKYLDHEAISGRVTQALKSHDNSEVHRFIDGP